MSAIDIFGLLVPVTYLAMLGIEALVPARSFPPIRLWRVKGFFFLTVQGLLATLTPLLIPGALAGRAPSDQPGRPRGGRRRRARLCRGLARQLRLAPQRAQFFADVAAVPPDPSQPAAGGHVRRGLFHPLETVFFS